MANFDDFKLAIEALSGGKNTIILDDREMPSVVVPFPRLKMSDLIKAAARITTRPFPLEGWKRTGSWYPSL